MNAHVKRKLVGRLENRRLLTRSVSHFTTVERTCASFGHPLDK